MKTVTIIHPYGSIGSIERVPFGVSEHNPTNYVSLASEIKTYTEQVEDKTALVQMQNCVDSAECIVFLGFAYHEQNMDLLRPDKPLARKEIYGIAFGMSEADKLAVINELNGSFPSQSGDRVRADVGLALTFLLSCSSLSLLLFRATKIAPVAGAALVSGRAGLLECDSDRLAPTLYLAAFTVTAALELAVLELVHDPAGDTFLPWGFACHLGFLLW